MSDYLDNVFIQDSYLEHNPSTRKNQHILKETREASISPTNREVAQLDHDDDIYKNSNKEPNETPRLEREHGTFGYRDGVTIGKVESLQEGFDEGFSLGAVLGLQSGQLMGLLEGIVEALRTAEATVTESSRGARSMKREGDGSNAKSLLKEIGDASGDGDDVQRNSDNMRSDARLARMQRLYDEAKKELSPADLFTPEYWNPDGTWKYNIRRHGEFLISLRSNMDNGDVKGNACTITSASCPIDVESDDEAVFDDIAASHPLIEKWSKIVETEIRRWNIAMDILTFCERFPSENATTSHKDNSGESDLVIKGSNTSRGKDNNRGVSPKRGTNNIAIDW